MIEIRSCIDEKDFDLIDSLFVSIKRICLTFFEIPIVTAQQQPQPQPQQQNTQNFSWVETK